MNSTKNVEISEELEKTPVQDNELAAVAERYAVAITPLVQELIDVGDRSGSVAAQFLPDARELHRFPGEHADPIGDEHHSPVKGIIHRYPDRLLLLPLRVCSVYCRFCFRRESVGHSNDAILGAAELSSALDYIRSHEEIWEVIITGGDPLILSSRRLDSILTELRTIKHVQVIRIHSRVPLVAPERIDRALVNSLRRAAPLYVVLHANHESEFTHDGEDACSRLVDAGIPMLGQSVLLRNINDDVDTLESLLRRFVVNRIKPYYLHHADRALGTAHFRTTISAGRQLSAALRGRVSGICQPNYVLDIPGGHGKSPLGPEYLENHGDGLWKVADYRGGTHDYIDESI